MVTSSMESLQVGCLKCIVFQHGVFALLSDAKAHNGQLMRTQHVISMYTACNHYAAGCYCHEQQQRIF